MPRSRISRHSGIGLIAVGTALALAACAGGPAAETEDPDTGASYPMTVPNCDEELTISEEPQSVLSIGTSAVELLDAAGASDRITARAGEFGSELPEGLRHTPDDAPIIDPADPAIETIVGAEADIIVGYGLLGASPEDVAAAGIPNVIIDGECGHGTALSGKTDFEAIFADVERLAGIFGTEDVADENLAQMRQELETLTATAGNGGQTQTGAVVYYFSESAAMSARGGLGIADDVLARAGLDNVYGDEDSVYVEGANIETLLDADPHSIVLAYGLWGETFEEAKQRLLADPGAANLTAVQNDRIIGVLASDLAPDPGALRGLRTILEATGALT
ncbi:ABC transporter substrate-binding protein [Brachybacterium tyrofermentans]|uniref:ABC transporter substrate-binding protein n=1 Tax=Brachybacterium tyrofermentans TaxID=47848 RepID=UPI001866149D|nr:ABC transporter substrate-binding protein [Brachybacterium tyrofermentans]